MTIQHFIEMSQVELFGGAGSDSQAARQKGEAALAVASSAKPASASDGRGGGKHSSVIDGLQPETSSGQAQITASTPLANKPRRTSTSLLMAQSPKGR